MKILIGIDPGVNTGIAVLDGQELTRVESMRIDQALDCVDVFDCICRARGVRLKVYIEDARKRGCSPKTSAAKAQGAGSVKRDCKIWEDFLTGNGIDFVLVAPQHNSTKLTADQFKKRTKWQGRTNDHSRDAAMLIFGR